jgi:hypothetical protein
MKEIWKPIEGFEGLYEISNLGNVKSLRRYHASERILKAYLHTNGYLAVNLYKNGKRLTKKIHRLVAETFIENHHHLCEVNHIDGCKTNNKIENLEWCTSQQNNAHAVQTGLRKSIKNNPSCSKRIDMYSNDGVFIRTFPSMHEAERITGIAQSNITRCCHGKRKTAGGYIWKHSLQAVELQ